MRLNRATLASAVVLLALGLAACDGSENARTIPTAGPDYIPPALIGPKVPGEDHGEEGSSYESEGADPNATTGPNE